VVPCPSRKWRTHESSDQAAAHLLWVRGELLDTLTVGWRYQTRRELARQVHQLKASAKLGISEPCYSFCQLSWPLLADHIETWLRSFAITDCVVIPIPGRSGLSEIFASVVCQQLRQTHSSIDLYRGALRRVGIMEVKSIWKWEDRREAAPSMFQLSRASIPSSVLLVDDVVASGGSLRACAELLRRVGARNVGALTLCGDVDGFERSSGWVPKHAQHTINLETASPPLRDDCSAGGF